VTTSPEAFEAVREALGKLGVKAASGEVALVPQNTVPVRGSEAQQLLRLLEALEDHDDIQSVAANADLDEDEVAKLSA
jgi:transcriptional/translational regulatory protein YebC/TACO1